MSSRRAAAFLTSSGKGLIAEKPFAPYAIAGAIVLLLLAGIYGAWSITLWIARNREKDLAKLMPLRICSDVARRG